MRWNARNQREARSISRSSLSYVCEPTFWQNGAEEIVLRPYQEECIEALRENKRKGHNYQILASMVGSGKTIMGAHLLHQCWQKEQRGMFVVDRINLLDQTSAVFDRFGIPHGVVASGHPRYLPNELIQVASIQTLARRGWPMADLIVADEIHVLYATMRKKIERKDCCVIGLTATPFTRGLGKFFSALVNVTTGNKLTKEGFLVPFKVWAAKEPDMTNAKVVAGEWTDQAASERSVKIIGDVVKEWREKGENRKTIAFGVDVAHCEELQRRFLMCGIRAELYTYLTGDEERDMMLREFRKPDSSIRVLISVAALSRGFDVPDVGCIIMCRPLRNSFTEFVQILGRGLRSHPSKQDCYVLDLAGNFMRHYPALIEFMEEGARHLDDGKVKQSKPSIGEEKKPRKCPKCKYVIGAGLHCPSCGYIFPPRAAVKHEAGDLSEFDGSAAIKLNREAKLRIYQELLHISIGRGYKKGWIAHTYRKLTGVWPVSMLEIPIEPSKETIEAVRRMHARSGKNRSTAILAQKTAIPDAIPEDLFA